MGRFSKSVVLTGVALFALTSTSMAAVEPLQSLTNATEAQYQTTSAVIGEGSAIEGKKTSVQVAFVSSCSDPWYLRSLIEHLTCGFSGQGWIN